MLGNAFREARGLHSRRYYRMVLSKYTKGITNGYVYVEKYHKF